MAKIHEEFTVIKISKLVKEGESINSILTPEIKDALSEIVSQAVAELTGASGLVVEVVED